MTPADPTPTPRVDLEELVAEGRRLLHDAPISKRRETTWLRWCDDHAADLLEAVEYACHFEKALREIAEGGCSCTHNPPARCHVVTAAAALARPHPGEEADSDAG